MSRIYAIGETVLDLLFKNNTLQQAVPGGAMLNTAVSLGRLQLPVFLLTEWGNDVAGTFIRDFLVRSGVDLSFVYEYNQGKTSLALASLDAQGNATYTFYKDYPTLRMQLEFPCFSSGDIVLFGSFFALDTHVRSKLVELLDRARSGGAFLIYDPNIRKNHLHQLPELRPLVKENFGLAHLVRASHEDFMNLFGISDSYEVFEQVEALGCDHIIMTRGGEEMIFMKPMVNTTLAPYPADVISTIGSGDTFNAGLIFSLHKRGIHAGNYRDLPACEWSDIMAIASAFAANACESTENYISESFARQILNSANL
jgi:fructokinase